MTSKLKVLATIILIVLFGTGLFAQPRPKPPVKPNFDKGRIVKLLNLDNSQKEKFFDITFDHQSKAIDLRAEIQKKKLELKKLMATRNINEGKILSLSEKIHELKGKLMRSKIRTWFDVYKILNPDQKEIWISHFERFTRMHNKGRFGHHGMGMMGKFRNFKGPKF